VKGLLEVLISYLSCDSDMGSVMCGALVEYRKDGRCMCYPANSWLDVKLYFLLVLLLDTLKCELL
jgi:hypothetical protein